ncbi:LOW QUALITY PROTEIN: olfactory receptor 10T2-like [Choloepus didactylus]|uniref:LOW QUALITY PROTEIN: olfactory receptor 10T2-like n=1 Tax=Choloepus didactylus TaxID=27675 RepID=UPI0018A0E84A|nr:LOW QUALITY PROTEIN: olfactory receptor 10T2-like [Choloepus didactylus]
MGNHTTVSTFFLWGFSNVPDQQGLLFVVIFFSHVTILTANVSIMVAIRLSHNLHSPMYFFLCGLAFSETCTTMVIIPRTLVDLLSDSKMISLPECATQMFFFFGLAANNCFIMAAMSYDRYTAIHNPLHYSMLMTRKICFLLMMASWVVGILVSLCIVIIVFSLSFCDSSIIQHFFCDISPVVSLACDSTYLHELVIFELSAFVLVGSFILIMISYVFIVTIVVKMSSAKGRYKAFSTCSSHLTVVSIHYGFASFVYLRPKNIDSFHEDMLMAVTYTMLTPLLNPIVYSLRNKEMKLALSKVLGYANRFISQMANKKSCEHLENVQNFNK